MNNSKDFLCIGGLEKQIRIVKEMILFPLMYGDIYAKFHLKPPRGLLFYGPPGTGKTLLASALAAECGNSKRKVSFISRKGADCLSMWVGESEKRLQNIFHLAQQNKPCIIFFDEVDGLAPARSNRHQDFAHASVVSTLLALMDGLDNNSEIIVIGATNRIDALDPALRRPGRFDKELYFPLPCYAARKDILMVHLKSWKQKPSNKFMSYLASKTVGFCGSDLQALCAQAVMCCIRRNYPQIYNSKSKHNINDRSLKVEEQDFMESQQSIVPSTKRVAMTIAKSLPVKAQALLQGTLMEIISKLDLLCPAGMMTSEVITGKATVKSISCPRIILCGRDDSHTRHLGPALLHVLEHLPSHVLDVTTLFETGRTIEEIIIQKIKGARHTLPALLYIPDLLSWWDLVTESVRVVFTSLLKSLDCSVNMLIVMTAKCDPAYLPAEIRSLFDSQQEQMYEVPAPGHMEKEKYFGQLFWSAGSSYSDVSNQSSSADLGAANNGAKRETKDNSPSNGKGGASAPRRGTETKRTCKMKLRSTFLTNTKKSPKRNSKRGRSLSERDSSSKRIKLKSGESIEGARTTLQDITENQKYDLLEKIIETTDNWLTDQLETLYAVLELSVHRNKENTYNCLEKSLSEFQPSFDFVRLNRNDS